MMMEIGPCYRIKLGKRIKLEHAYARDANQFEFAEVREEDPLKIYPEDFNNIKIESEDVESIALKVEFDSGGSGNSENSYSVNLRGERSHEAKRVSDKENNFYYSDCVKPLNCLEVEVENKTDVSAPTTSDYNDTVPRHVFLELQHMYERAMSDFKVLSEKLPTDGNTVKKPKRAPRRQKNTNSETKSESLQNQVKKLKDELYNAKVKEQAHKTEVAMRIETELKKFNTKLEKQLGEIEKLKKDNAVQVAELKRQLVGKDNTIKTLKTMLRQQVKTLNNKKMLWDNALDEQRLQLEAKRVLTAEYQSKCTMLTQKQAIMEKKFLSQKTELAKLKLDIDVMDKSIIDSLKTRQLLKEQVVKLENELQEIKNSPTLAVELQEAQKNLTVTNRRIDQLQKSLLAEKKLADFTNREKDRQLEEQKRKYKEIDKELATLKQSVPVLVLSLNQNIEEINAIKQEKAKLQLQLTQKEEEAKAQETKVKQMEEENRTRQCEYCGF